MAKQKYKKIPLTQGKYALVDADDYEWLSKFKWAFSSIGYAVRGASIRGGLPRRTILMHREIISTPYGMYTDHINGNGLDNRRNNLRVCTKSQNGMNQGKSRGKSKYKGVYQCPKSKKWCAQITLNRKTHHLGTFSTEERAALVYNRATEHFHGEYAKTNKIRRK